MLLLGKVGDILGHRMLKSVCKYDNLSSFRSRFISYFHSPINLSSAIPRCKHASCHVRTPSYRYNVSRPASLETNTETGLLRRSVTTLTLEPATSWEHYLRASDKETENVMVSDMLVFEDFLTSEEESSLLQEIEPYMKRLRYEYDHWDDAIHGYRETERKQWSPENVKILDRVRELAFPPHVSQQAYVHILDLAKEGYIKPHVDSIRFCGDTIAGVCLLSPCVMRLVHDKDKSHFADVLLRQRSLYVMKNRARYEYTHEVLQQSESYFNGQEVIKDRRISVICRNEPASDVNT